jgi:hypothetical protein
MPPWRTMLPAMCRNIYLVGYLGLLRRSLIVISIWLVYQQLNTQVQYRASGVGILRTIPPGICHRHLSWASVLGIWDILGVTELWFVPLIILKGSASVIKLFWKGPYLELYNVFTNLKPSMHWTGSVAHGRCWHLENFELCSNMTLGLICLIRLIISTRIFVSFKCQEN